MSRKNPVLISSDDDVSSINDDVFSTPENSESSDDEYVASYYKKTEEKPEYQNTRKTRSQGVPSWFVPPKARKSRPHQSNNAANANAHEQSFNKSKPYTYKSDQTSHATKEQKQKSKTSPSFSQASNSYNTYNSYHANPTPNTRPYGYNFTQSTGFDEENKQKSKTSSQQSNPPAQSKRKRSKSPIQSDTDKRAKRSPSPPKQPCPAEADYNMTCGQLFAEWEWNALYNDIRHFRVKKIWPPGVTENDVRRRLRKLQLRTHPDKQIYQSNPLYPYQHCSNFKNHCFNAIGLN